jgi:hypothetical protein
MIVTQYKESTDTESTKNPNTMTAVDLSKMDILKDEIDLLAEALHAGYTAAAFQTFRDNAGHFYTTDPLNVPYTDLYSFCNEVIDDAGSAAAEASDVKTALDAAVISCYAGGATGLQLDDYYATDDVAATRGLSIFISHGEDGDYAEHWWYTNQSILATIVSTGASVELGSLDFCTSDTNEIVETWREMFEAWYKTPGSY